MSHRISSGADFLTGGKTFTWIKTASLVSEMRQTLQTANQYHPQAAWEFPKGRLHQRHYISKQNPSKSTNKHRLRSFLSKKKSPTLRANKRCLMVFKVSICFSVFHCQVRRKERAAEGTVSRRGLKGHGWDYSTSKDPILWLDMPTSLQCIFLWQCGVTLGQKAWNVFTHMLKDKWNARC